MSIIRLALFEGRVKPGCDAAFDAYVARELVPLWRSFPNLESFRLMRGCASDDGAPPHALILAFNYPSRAAMEEALASPQRAKSRDVTQGLFAFFDGRISHIVAESTEFPGTSAD
jgi:hypothetical protein